MSTINDGGAAFPCNRTVGAPPQSVEDFRVYGTGNEGMSLRDYFAAKAMQALIASDRMTGCAENAYQIADAMLAARGEVQP